MRSDISTDALSLDDRLRYRNCMFRALCDQLEGNQTNHRPYRVTVVDYIVSIFADRLLHIFEAHFGVDAEQG